MMYERTDTIRERVNAKMDRFAAMDRMEVQENHLFRYQERSYDKADNYRFGLRRAFPELPVSVIVAESI